MANDRLERVCTDRVRCARGKDQDLLGAGGEADDPSRNPGDPRVIVGNEHDRQPLRQRKAGRLERPGQRTVVGGPKAIGRRREPRRGIDRERHVLSRAGSREKADPDQERERDGSARAVPRAGSQVESSRREPPYRFAVAVSRRWPEAPPSCRWSFGSGGGSAGAIPSASRCCGPLAQLAEQQTLNLRVEGSIPSRLTTYPPSSPFSSSDPGTAMSSTTSPKRASQTNSGVLQRKFNRTPPIEQQELGCIKKSTQHALRSRAVRPVPESGAAPARGPFIARCEQYVCRRMRAPRFPEIRTSRGSLNRLEQRARGHRSPVLAV